MITTNRPCEKVFEYFKQLTRIPRPSGYVANVSNYLAMVARQNGLWYKQDSLHNIIIKRPASQGYENFEPVIIQGHLDMVCEKTPETNINFWEDALNIKEEGDFIFAKGTTLGADNGIAIAYALAILTDKSINAPEIEAIFTADEETGMFGAMDIDLSCTNSKMLLNIDSENEGVFTVSCAGGVTCEGFLSAKSETHKKNGYKIRIHSLTGGHSGVEIHKNRANANILAGKLLKELSQNYDLLLSCCEGGKKHNAIPSECEIIISTDSNIENAVLEFESKVLKQFSATDPELKIDCTSFSDEEIKIFDKTTTQRVIAILSTISDGVYCMSEDIEGLVKTSSNLGILETRENEFYFLSSLRSSEEKSLDELYERISKTFEQNCAKAERSGEYPAWEYKKDSPLRDIMCKVFEQQYGKAPKIEAIHAGLECGIFCGKRPELDCVSFGPDMFDIHTPKERLSISSAKRTWDFLLNVLENLKIEK